MVQFFHRRWFIVKQVFESCVFSSALEYAKGGMVGPEDLRELSNEVSPRRPP